MPFRRSNRDAEQRDTPVTTSLNALQTAGLIPGDGPAAPVTEDRALGLTAVYRAVDLISSGVAGLPVQASTAGAPAVLPDWVRQPNVTDDLPALITDVLVGALLRGNGYALALRDTAGRLGEIVSVDPARIGYDYLPDGRGFYGLKFRLDAGPAALTAGRDLLHVWAMRKPGNPLGVSPLSYAGASIGVAAAADDHARTVLDNHAAPGVMIEIPTAMTPEGVNVLRQSWYDRHGGPRNGGVGIVTEGGHVVPLTVTPADAELLATRRFSVSDIARIYGVPNHLLADSTGSTSWGSGLQSLTGSFALFSLAPWAHKVAAALSALARYEPGPVDTLTLSLDGLTRADMPARYAAYLDAITAGWLTPDDVRSMEGLPAVDGLVALPAGHRPPATSAGPIAA